MLTAISFLDTTDRSAKLAAETCVLSICNTQAKQLRSLVAAEKESLIKRLKDIEEVEKTINCIDVRDDIDTYFKRECQSLVTACVHTEGMASALAVLNYHSPMFESQTNDDSEISEGNRWSEMREVGVVARDDIERLLRQLFEIDKECYLNPNESNRLDNAVTFLEAAIRPKNAEARARRASLCHALNNQRSIRTKLVNKIFFHGLGKVFLALLDGCTRINSDIANAKMCMMLSETFYFENSFEPISNKVDSPNRTNRLYIKSLLLDHPIWSDDNFWEQALYQCISEALQRCKIVNNVYCESDRTNAEEREDLAKSDLQVKWHDLTWYQRVEAAQQLHSVVFSQLAALSHSMIEFGCGYDKTTSFVRRLSVRYQLPISRRAMLLDHIKKRREKVQQRNEIEREAEDS